MGHARAGADLDFSWRKCLTSISLATSRAEGGGGGGFWPICIVIFPEVREGVLLLTRPSNSMVPLSYQNDDTNWSNEHIDSVVPTASS